MTGSDHNLWFTDPANARVGRLTPPREPSPTSRSPTLGRTLRPQGSSLPGPTGTSGSATIRGPSTGSPPRERSPSSRTPGNAGGVPITAGPDGNLWVAGEAPADPATSHHVGCHHQRGNAERAGRRDHDGSGQHPVVHHPQPGRGGFRQSGPASASPPPPPTRASTPAGTNGGVNSFGADTFHGSLPSLGVHPAQPVVGIATTPGGYRLTGSDGGVYAFGSAGYYGSLPGLHVIPNRPIVGIAATPSGNGYWLVGADGGVYAFGSAGYYGSLPGLHVISGQTDRRDRLDTVRQRLLAGRSRRRGVRLRVGRLRRLPPGPARDPAKPIVGIAHEPVRQWLLAGRVATVGCSPSAALPSRAAGDSRRRGRHCSHRPVAAVTG